MGTVEPCASGATRYFPKPFDVGLLTLAIKEAIGG